MIINSKQIEEALENCTDASKHWIFNNIEDTQHLYEGIRIPHNRIIEIRDETTEFLTEFTPTNSEVFDQLFPKWRDIQKEARVELIVGAPSNYDMMVRNDMIYIDIQNLDKYLSNGYEIIELLKILITHEFVHLCINKDYSLEEDPSYIEQLDYILFQEGFAHAIPYLNNLEVEKYNETFIKSCIKLRKALEETSIEKQNQYLLDADTGDYWDKYGAIAGKLFILNNSNEILNIYNRGYQNFHTSILEDYKVRFHHS